MNEIIKQRIEKAVKKTACPKCVFNDGGTCNNDSECCNLYDDMISLMRFALDNQWISVEEGLPEDCYSVFVRYMANDIPLFSTGDYEETDKVWYVDGYGFHDEVTHWMPIPKIGGEL